MSTLTVKINEINELLRSFGPVAVQKIDFGSPVRYGYKPQYIFDAVNQIIEPENWRYELIKEEIFETQAVAEIKLFLKTDDEWICKGSHKGQMSIVKGNVGDAQKGAITDALQKCFSLCSIGQDSYRGLLETVFNSRGPQAPSRQSLPKSTQQPSPTQQQQQQQPTPPVQASPQQSAPISQPAPQTPTTPQTSQAPPATPSNLPMIDGVTYQHHDSIVVATGKVYDKKELLKAVGFKWNKENKNWYKELTH